MTLKEALELSQVVRRKEWRTTSLRWRFPTDSLLAASESDHGETIWFHKKEADLSGDDWEPV